MSQYISAFRGHCTNECQMFPTLTSFNTVGRPERFRSLTLTVPRKRSTKQNTVDLSGTRDFGKALLKSSWYFKLDLD